MAPLFLQLHASFIDGDLYQPSAEFRFESECRQGLKCFQQGFLANLLSISRIARNSQGCEIDAAFVGPDQVIECFEIPPIDAVDEFRFALLASRRLTDPIPDVDGWCPFQHARRRFGSWLEFIWNLG